MARILIIEDEPTIAVALQDDLELEGYEVDVAEDGEAGAARALDREHDLILLDLMLPKKDGFTVCREVRAAGIDTPIIVLTAKGQEVDYLLYGDEGHGFARPENKMAFYAAAEQFLARHLGGRCEEPAPGEQEILRAVRQPI